MNIKQFEQSVDRTFKSCATEEVDGQTMDLLHSALGLSGEVGELVDTIKKHVFYKQEFDMVNAEEELGDILYYVTSMCITLGLPLDYIMSNNKAKLDIRYPDGYTNECAKSRFDKQLDEYIAS